MDNLTDTQLAEQEKARKQLLARGNNYEDISGTNGFLQIKDYIETQVKVFANDAIVKGFENWDEYQRRRGEVNGLRNLLGDIQTSIEYAKEQRDKTTTS